MDDWQIPPIVCLLCGVGLFILAFVFRDTGFAIYALFFIMLGCLSALNCDSGGAS